MNYNESLDEIRKEGNEFSYGIPFIAKIPSGCNGVKLILLMIFCLGKMK